MRFKNVALESITYAKPEEIWTSEQIEVALEPLYKRIGLNNGRLELMTGIKQRYHWNAKTLPSEASTLAGKKLFEKSQFSPQNIDLLIHAGVCRDKLEPSTASYIHKNLKISPNAQILDVSNACLGVLNAIVLASGLIESGNIKTALIVSGENGKPLLDWTIKKLNGDQSINRRSLKPYFANLTIGSGAVAILLCHKELSKRALPLISGGIGLTDSSSCTLCEGNADGKDLVMQTDAEHLLEAGIALSKSAWSKFKNTMHWDEKTPDVVITHQVGKKHKSMLLESLNLEKEKDFSTVEQFGNTGSVALPLTLAVANEEKVLQKDNNLVLMGIGSGLSSIILGVKWQ